MHTVHQVSQITGVSVRTLHHYDQLGLLLPAQVTEAGYRLYDDAALQRLQSILIYRELGFPLKEIKAILDDPGYDPKEALARQITLLEAQLPVPTPPQESALESSASQAPVPESSGEEPEEPEEEPATEPAPAPAPVQRPDYLGVGSPALRGEAEYLGDVEAGILDGINYEREDMGAAPVQWDDNLADAACIRAAELYHNKYTAHTRPNGERWITVVDRDVPVGYTSAGEILAFIGTAQNVDKIESADYWVNQWVNSSAHYECMINAKYTHAGSAVVFAWDQADQMYYGYACTIFAAW